MERDLPADPIDCSVLVPVLNEERHIERSRGGDAPAANSPAASSSCLPTAARRDRTREILETLAREDPRIRVLDNPNRSVSSGLNVALRHARGRWVARMDAHTEYPEDYAALGVARLRAGRHALGERPAGPEGSRAGVAGGRAGAGRRSVAAGRASGVAPDSRPCRRVRARFRRVRRRLGARHAARVRRLG